jgi:hypothetical protein
MKVRGDIERVNLHTGERFQRVSDGGESRLERFGQPECPHCGGLHYGQRFDDCTYVNILKDPKSTTEQRKNAAAWLENNLATAVVSGQRERENEVKYTDLTGKLFVGAHVVYVDPVAGQHEALITAVWGDPKDCPLVNLVYVEPDNTRQDSYGRQISRATSLCHLSKSNVHGQYYMMSDETPNPIVKPTES